MKKNLANWNIKIAREEIKREIVSNVEWNLFILCSYWLIEISTIDGNSPLYLNKTRVKTEESSEPTNHL